MRDKIKVSPSTGVTMQPGLPHKLVHRGFTTRIDMDTLAMVLDHGHDDSEGYDSAEFVLQPQSTDFSSHKD